MAPFTADGTKVVICKRLQRRRQDEGSKRQRRISVVAAHAGKATDSLANTAGVSQTAVGIGKGGRSWSLTDSRAI